MELPVLAFLVILWGSWFINHVLLWAVQVKALFQHAVTCTRKVTGGCQLCRRMWMLLQMHAKQCQAAECPVPRCRELREMRRRQIARQEDQRRVAYKGMLRAQQQAARGLPAPIAVGGSQGYA